MAKTMFLIKGNICGDRVRLARAMHKPPMTQDDLAREINLMGMDMTKLIIPESRRISATSVTAS